MTLPQHFYEMQTNESLLHKLFIVSFKLEFREKLPHFRIFDVGWSG